MFSGKLNCSQFKIGIESYWMGNRMGIRTGIRTGIRPRSVRLKREEAGEGLNKDHNEWAVCAYP
jgi:hypothetical protein